jgi:hypothetical protein
MGYLGQLDTILTILLGWLLGLLTPSIAERIRRPYRRRDLERSVVEEMLDLQHTMAVFAYQSRARRGEVTNAFLDQFLPIVEGYKGPDRNEDLVRATRSIRSLPEAQRAAADLAQRKPNVGVSLRQYALPLFASQIADLTICSAEFQRFVLKIRHLELFNQLVPYTQSLFDKTFNKPNPEDREALIGNLEEGYRAAGKRAEHIMQAIDDLNQQFGSGK